MTNLIPNPSPRWDRQQIRAARQAPLLPLLEKRRLQLCEGNGGNYEVLAYPGLVIKDNYWHWPQRNLAGNTIDFHVQILGLSFDHAMREIHAAS